MVSPQARKIINSTKAKRVRVPSSSTKLGSAGYDNPRDDIEKTKSLRELQLPFTAGSVLFMGSDIIEEDNLNLFWNVGRTQLETNLLKITSDGTQAAPALKFNDTNTGFFKSGDSISLSINNATITTVDATGLDMNTHKIVGVVDPTTDQEAATKKYVDDTHVPAGSDTEIQFNNAGSFGGDPGLIWNNVDKKLELDTTGGPNGVEIFTNAHFLHIRPRTNAVGALRFVKFGQTNPNLVINEDGKLSTTAGTIFLDPSTSVFLGADTLAFPTNSNDLGSSSFQWVDLNLSGALKSGGVDFLNLNNTTQDELIVNEGGVDIDFRVESANEDHLFFVDGGLDVIRMGDFDTNYLEVSTTGDLTFVGTAGLPFAEIYARDNTTTTSTSTTKAQILIFDTNGQ